MIKLDILKLRMIAYSSLVIVSFAELIVSSAVLGWSLKVYRGGYIRANPQLVGCSAVTMFLFLFFLFLPNLRARIPVLLEIVMQSIMLTLWMISLSWLYIATPGLMTGCGRFLICKGWITMLVLAWGAVISLGAAVAFLLGAATYVHIKHRDYYVWKTYANHYDWKNPSNSDSTWGVERQRVNVQTSAPRLHQKSMDEKRFQPQNEGRQFSIE